jgi:hypothetical protein
MEEANSEEVANSEEAEANEENDEIIEAEAYSFKPLQYYIDTKNLVS